MNETKDISQMLASAWDLRRRGDYHSSRKLVDKARELCAEDDYQSLGRIFHIYRQFESDHNQYEKALDYNKKSLAYYKLSGNVDKIAHSTRHIADLQMELGDYEEAETNYRKVILLYKSNHETHNLDLANANYGFGLCLEKRGKTNEAIQVWKETKDLYASCNLQQGVSEAQKRLDKLKEL